MKCVYGRRNRGSRRKGAVLPLVAASLTLLIGFMALAVDVGYLYSVSAEVQRTADAASLGGAAVLLESDEWAEVGEQAMADAYSLASMNPVGGINIADDSVIEVGYWEWTTHTFTAGDIESTVTPNAVRVVANRNDINLFFASVIGVNSTDVSRESIAAVSSGQCAGIWGIQGLETSGGVFTDSYISTAGPYAEGNIYPNGDLCSCADIVQGGSFEINGDVMHGEGYEHVVNGNSGVIYGVISDLTCSNMSSDADFAQAAFENDNDNIGLTSNGDSPYKHAGSYDLWLTSDDSITLTGGVYYFDSVRMSGQAVIYVTGPTVIFISGDAVMTGGGIVNVTQDPANLVIYSEGLDLDVRGGAGFYGAIIAPDTDVTLSGTSDFFGTIVGLTVEIDGDTNIHVDESLLESLLNIKPVRPVLVR
jgi:Flp pilus assembly protein TadG